MKKIISIIMAAAMLMSFALCASAQSDTKLKFSSDGKFKILNIADCQDTYPQDERMFDFIYKVLEKYDPDLVVLGGDNAVGPGETKAEEIEALVKPYVETQTYFTMVFGNHDHQQDVDKAQLFEYYEEYGGEYFLGFNEDSEESGRVGTHYLPIYASDSDEIKYALYMIDSGNYEYDENGNELGYECVSKEQIEWYKNVRDELKDETGDYVPAIMFQHIVPGDVYDYLYYSSAIDLGSLGKSYYGKHYTYVPKLQNFTGYLNEGPCPGYYNYGQVDAAAEKGDVQAIFVGHDHVNSYDVEIKGLHVINTPAITYHSYSNDINHGCRLIVIDEKTQTYETEVVSINALAAEDKEYADKIGMSQSTAKLYIFLDKFVMALQKTFAVFGKVLDLFGVQ